MDHHGVLQLNVYVCLTRHGSITKSNDAEKAKVK